MISRKIDAFLDTFFRSTNKALLVTGARQIGKTFSIREAANRNFEHFVVYMPIYMLMFLEKEQVIDVTYRLDLSDL